jgi:hypothetical protein
MLDGLKTQHSTLQNRIRDLELTNKEAIGKLGSKFQDFGKVKMDGFEVRNDFEMCRDDLEDKYHEIIEENIRRERENKKEQARRRTMTMNASISTGDPLKRADEEAQAKQLEEEDVSDRTPILDILIEKWKFYNKYKKQMLEKYTKNAISIRDAFDKMMKFLGIEDFQDLPVVLEKMEDQMSSIEMFISKLTIDIDHLEEKKKLIEFKISTLTDKNSCLKDERSNFHLSKKKNIEQLRTHINELKLDTERKREFFIKMQQPTDEFLNLLEGTYLSEYIPEKVAVNKDVNYNEANVQEVLANVEDYQKLIDEFDVNSEGKNNNPQQSPNLYDRKTDILVNKDIEKLKNEMRIKLEQFKKENYINNNFYSSVKGDVKSNVGFDETIKKMADEIIKVVNTQGLNKEATLKKKK